MWKVARPTRLAASTFLTCISRVRNLDLKERLEGVEEDITEMENNYIGAATTKRLNDIPAHDNVAGSVTNKEMVSVYEYRMVDSRSPGRPIYDEIISASPHNRCPFCGHRTVSTLDHHLPKKQYSELTVTPVNLIPSCSDCNKDKKTAAPQQAEEVILHPYFDDIENDRWLYAEVIEQEPASVGFFVQEPGSWDGLTTARVNNHFETLKLDKLYRSQAADEIVNIRHQLNLLFNSGGKIAVQAHLRDCASSRIAARLNSWQSATYEALFLNDWFCEGGFR